MVFLGHYHVLPDWHSERRSIHLYKHLSTFLKKSRTPEQCKNIHSLLKRKFNSLEEVVDAMQKELQAEENYDKFVSKYER
jgi:DNA anti-recombination protein RmuC